MEKAIQYRAGEANSVFRTVNMGSSSGDTEGNKIPFTFAIDKAMHARLKAASRSTRIPMSEIVRLSLDNVLKILGDPENPTSEGLAELLAMRQPDN